MKTLLERIVVNFLRKPKEPPVAPKKTLLERIAVEFLGEIKNDISYYAYNTDNNTLVHYPVQGNAQQAIKDEPNRIDPKSPAAAAARADAGFDDSGQWKEPDTTTGEPEGDTEEEPKGIAKVVAALRKRFSAHRDSIFRGEAAPPGTAPSVVQELSSGHQVEHLGEHPDASDLELIAVTVALVGGTPVFEAVEGGEDFQPTSYGVYKRDITEVTESLQEAADNAEGQEKEEREQLLKEWNEMSIKQQALIINSIRSAREVNKHLGQNEQFVGGPTESYDTGATSTLMALERIKALPEDATVVTAEGMKVPRDVMIRMIEEGGARRNPGDMTYIRTDPKDPKNVMVYFASMKTSLTDPQGNSSPIAFMKKMRDVVGRSNLTKTQKAKIIKAIDDNIDIQTEARRKAREALPQMASDIKGSGVRMKDLVQQMEDMSTTKAGKKRWDDMRKRVRDGERMCRNKECPPVSKYLPDDVKPERATDEQVMQAWLDFKSDPDYDASLHMTTDDRKVLDRLITGNDDLDFDDYATRGETQNEILINAEKDLVNTLNDSGIQIGGIPAGDHFVLTEIWDSLHFDMMDPGGAPEGSVFQYPGLFGIHAGSDVVNAENMRGCMPTDTKKEFLKRAQLEFEGTSVNKKGQITGMSKVISFVTAGGKKVRTSMQTNRSKTGPGGTQQSLAYFGKEVRECLQGKGKPKDKSVNASVRPLLRSLIIRELDRIKNGN